MKESIDIIKSIFKNRELVIATKHKKEEVIAPILETCLGVKCIIPKNIDTDILGTFTGEVDRVDSPLEAARKKCELAMTLTNCDLAVASEGSFGAHPSIPFVHANDEILILIDKKNKLEIIARELSTNTNFDGTEITSEKELVEFINKAKFPSHKVIIRKEKEHIEDIYKNLKTLDGLKKTFEYIFLKHKKAYVETDMRAMNNPTRMAIIKLATQKLADKIKSCCLKCNTPGFSITGVELGLPCNNCGFPTKSPLFHLYSCIKCQYKSRIMYPNKKETEEAMFCDLCNP